MLSYTIGQDGQAFRLNALVIVALAAAARAQPPAPEAASPIVFENVSNAAGLSFVLDQHPDPREAPGRDDGRRAGRVRLRRRRPARHLLHQRRAPAVAREGIARRLEPPVPQRRRAAIHGRDRAGGRARRRATPRARPPATTTTTATSICSWPAFSGNQLLPQHAATAGSRTSRPPAGIKSSTWSVAGGWFDYDNDGRLDLFVVNYVDWTPADEQVLRRLARGTCASTAIPRHYAGPANALYRNRGDGTFEDVTARSGHRRSTSARA